MHARIRSATLSVGQIVELLNSNSPLSIVDSEQDILDLIAKLGKVFMSSDSRRDVAVAETQLQLLLLSHNSEARRQLAYHFLTHPKGVNILSDRAREEIADFRLSNPHLVFKVHQSRKTEELV